MKAPRNETQILQIDEGYYKPVWFDDKGLWDDYSLSSAFPNEIQLGLERIKEALDKPVIKLSELAEAEKQPIIHGCEPVKVEQQCAICGDTYWAVDDNETELCGYCESKKKYITDNLKKSMYECDENVKQIIRDFDL